MRSHLLSSCIIALFSVLLSGASPANAADWKNATHLIGRASVIDGDTIEIRSQRIRLHGIDAPESRQLCIDREGGRYRCGQAAANFLYDVLLDRTVNCVWSEKDRYGRLIAECFIAVDDNPRVSINGLMVIAGHALAYRRYSTDFVDAEAAARDNHRGIWEGSFDEPWEWRRQKR